MPCSGVLTTSLHVPQRRKARALILPAVASQNPAMDITMPVIVRLV